MKILSLTEKQKEQLSVYREKWIKIGLSTEPANREKAEIAIKEMYRLSGLKDPEKIVWCGSPLSQGLTRAIILNKKLIKDIGKQVSVWSSVADSVRDSVWSSVADSVRSSVGDSVEDSVRSSVEDSVRSSVEDSVWSSVWSSVADSVRSSVWSSVGDSVWSSVRSSVGDSVGDSVWSSVRSLVRDSVADSVRSSVEDSVWYSGYGQHDANWLAFYDFFKNECGLVEETKKLNGLIEQAKNAGWYLPHEKICWVSERHNLLKLDDEGRLHSLNSPALSYPDGWSIYAIHGVRVPEYIIQRPNEITVDLIEKENNQEIKRVMIDKYGQDRYMQDCGAQLIQSDDCGELYVKPIANDETMTMVKVLNSTPEPDGTVKIYWLRVPPNTPTAKAGIAWTFGMDEKEYEPMIES